MERNYEYEIKLKWSSIMPAENKEKAKKMIKEQFEEDHNITLEDNEIKFIK